VKVTATRPKITAAGDGPGVVGQALAGLRQRRRGHDPGRITVDVAVMLADGGEAIADLAVRRNEAGLFGSVASDPTAWRLLSLSQVLSLATPPGALEMISAGR
jgi:hypothetical protein